jgi:cytochrome c oxidase assembly factor CtaG
VFVAVALAWRLSPVVDALVRHAWLSIVESLTLVVVGVALWLDLIESDPFKPCTTRPFRIGASAIAMWVIWIDAYVMAMTKSSWYPAFESVSHRALSVSADQQLTAGVLWLFAALTFVPVVFWNLNQWLRSEEDPNDELYRLVRQERTRGFFGTDS